MTPTIWIVLRTNHVCAMEKLTRWDVFDRWRPIGSWWQMHTCRDWLQTQLATSQRVFQNIQEVLLWWQGRFTRQWLAEGQPVYSMFLVNQHNRDIHLERVDNKGVLKGQFFVTLALALASTMHGLGFGRSWNICRWSRRGQLQTPEVIRGCSLKMSVPCGFCNHCWRKCCPFRQRLLLLSVFSARVAWLCGQTELGKKLLCQHVFLKCNNDL